MTKYDNHRNLRRVGRKTKMRAHRRRAKILVLAPLTGSYMAAEVLVDAQVAVKWVDSNAGSRRFESCCAHPKHRKMNGFPSISGRIRPGRAEAQISSPFFTARLKSCPDTKPKHNLQSNRHRRTPGHSRAQSRMTWRSRIQGRVPQQAVPTQTSVLGRRRFRLRLRSCCLL